MQNRIPHASVFETFIHSRVIVLGVFGLVDACKSVVEIQLSILVVVQNTFFHRNPASVLTSLTKPPKILCLAAWHDLLATITGLSDMDHLVITRLLKLFYKNF